MNPTAKSSACALLALLAALAMTASVSAQQDHIPWKYDLEQAKQVAAEQDQLILMHFSASWCAPCKEIERFVFVNPMAIQAIGREVVPVKLDVDLHTQIAEEYGVTTVPYDVIITPAGHVISERSSPRSSDGYQQMIEQAKEAAGSLSEQVVREVADLRSELRRQQEAIAAEAPAEKSYGGLAASEANQFRSRYSAPAGFQVPKFENPKPWSQSGSTVKTEGKTDGVIDGQFVAPTGQFKPTTQRVATPSVAAPEIPQSPAEARQFAAPLPVVRSQLQTRGFAAAQPNSSLSDPNAAGNPDYPANSFQATAAPHSQPTRIVNPMAQSKIAAEQLATAEPTETPQASTASWIAGQDDDLAESGSTTSTSTPAAFVAESQTPQQTLPEKRTPGFLPPTSSFQPLRKSAAVSTASQPLVSAPKTTPIAHEMGLEGYCCVTLMEEQKWVKGDKKWGCIHRGRLFLFSSQDYRDRFQKSPDMFSPLLGGSDPVDYHAQGKLTDGLRKHGVFYGEDDGPAVIVLFANAENRDKFEADPAEYLRAVRQAMSRVDNDLKLR